MTLLLPRSTATLFCLLFCLFMISLPPAAFLMPRHGALPCHSTAFSKILFHTLFDLFSCADIRWCYTYLMLFWRYSAIWRLRHYRSFSPASLSSPCFILRYFTRWWRLSLRYACSVVMPLIFRLSPCRFFLRVILLCLCLPTLLIDITLPLIITLSAPWFHIAAYAILLRRCAIHTLTPMLPPWYYGHLRYMLLRHKSRLSAYADSAVMMRYTCHIALEGGATAP